MALTVIPLILLASIAAVAYYVSVNPSYQQENSLPPASIVPTLTSSTTPKQTAAPDPKVSFTLWDAPSGAITQSPTIIILSPQNKTYSTNNITLTVNVGSQFWVIDSVYYEADWQEGYHRIFTVQSSYVPSLKVSINVNFTGIPNGSHRVTVYANMHNDAHGSSSVSFTTDAFPPRISVLTIENKTYYTPDLPLNFTVDKPTSWIVYSLDGQENATISENRTMQGLSYGTHSMILYANDTVGNVGSSEKVYFSISHEPEPFPTTLIIAGVASIALVAVVFLIYRRKQELKQSR